MTDYLALHQQVDICLDTYPYNGGTTTLHALWMGVPTLTLAGNNVAGRSGACILGHVDLAVFVAQDATDFVMRGLAWVDNLSSLASVRTHLRERFQHSAVGQPAIIAAGLERALRIMWQRWCLDLPAESFEVSVQVLDETMQ
jgi:predicted O-linked N-acetylglucosamine transferase (SPINDLY family)